MFSAVVATQESAFEQVVRESQNYVPPISPEELEKKKKRDDRIEHCGEYHSRFHPLSQEWYSYKRYCGYWRECEECFYIRQRKFYRRYREAVSQADDKIRFVILDTAGANFLVKRFRKTGIDYWRVPIKDDKHKIDEDTMSDEDIKKHYKKFALYYVFFDSRNTTEPGKLASSVKLEWDLLALTPLGLRSSGKLGTVFHKQEEEENERAFVVDVPDLRLDLPRGVTREDVYEETYKRIAPEDRELKFDETILKDQIALYLAVLMRVVEGVGGTVVEGTAKMKITFKMYQDELRRRNPPPPTAKNLDPLVQLELEEALETSPPPF